MISPLIKRFRSSNIEIKQYWFPIISDEYLNLPSMETMIVARVRHHQLTPEILKLINEIYSWDQYGLKHIRRLYQHDHDLDILLYPESFPNKIHQNLFEKYFHSQVQLMKIPLNPCLVKWQYQYFINNHWPNIIFRENLLIEKSIVKRELEEDDCFILNLLQKFENETNQSNCAIIVNNLNKKPMVASCDYRHEHPLQHSTMIAIDLISEKSIYSRRNLLDNLIEKEKEKENQNQNPYLLNECSIYLSYEPCIMCSMALLHSRIKNVFFRKQNFKSGALISNYKLHTLKKTNHRFHVYQLVEQYENKSEEKN